MVVIDAVEVVVLVVPAKRREERSHVQPGNVDAVERDLDVAQHGAGGGGQVVEVPVRLPAMYVCEKGPISSIG